MLEIERKLLLALAAGALTAALLLATLRGGANPRSAPATANIVTCRVLEAHTSKQLGVAAIVFHQRDASDRDRLGALLRQHPEASVEIQTADGAWQTVTVLRLKSCFGRGLLLLPLGTAKLPEKSEFLLKFPSD